MFTKATGINKKLKVLVYGQSGAGKTHFALTFPRPAVIDAEGGTEMFGGRFDFDVLRTKDIDEVLKAVESITPKQYDTVVVDPITVLWQVTMEAGQMAAEKRAIRQKRSADEATLTPRDWGIIKRKVNALYTRLVNMPTHVVVCGRIKDINESRGTEVVKVGERVDAEKSTEYLFDVIIKIEIGKDGQRVGIVEKDRSGKLQGKRIVNPSFSSLSEIIQAAASGNAAPVAQDSAQVAEKMAAEFDEKQPEAAPSGMADIEAAAAKNVSNAFLSPAAAIQWGFEQGAFRVFIHAENAYEKLKREHSPKTAEEMATLWRADVARRLAENAHGAQEALAV